MNLIVLMPAARRWASCLPWPLPALLAWAAAWAVFAGGVHGMGLTTPVALLPASGMALAASLAGTTPWRRVFIALGFPLSLVATGVLAGVPAWAWLLPMVLLVLVYPLRSWRDAPLFPTPLGALQGLAATVPLPAGARVLDAGCGLGDALHELHREYPHATLFGFEWSWPLRLACAWRAPFATVRRADIWAEDWSGYDLVYLFQRPESMPRAAAKAAQELPRGAWLISLEFAVPGVKPERVLRCVDGRMLWLYLSRTTAAPSSLTGSVRVEPVHRSD